MEDRCVICGEDVSDLNTLVCKKCIRESDKMANPRRARYLKMERRRRKYQEWLDKRPSRWRIISYWKWLNSEPKLKY